MLAKITKADAKWLIEEYAPKKGYRVDHSTIPMFLKAYNIMKGGDRKIECTQCEGKAIAQMANSMYSQYEIEIKAKLNDKPRRRKKK